MGVTTGTAQMKTFRRLQKDAVDFVGLDAMPAAERDPERHAALKTEVLVQYLILDSQANVLCPATKLWNTGHGANLMRVAVSLVGGYGITEDCPGFLGHKWMDAQLEATYEGPEAVQRRQLTVTMTNEVFLAVFRSWIAEMRKIAAARPGTGACTLATGMELWLWTLEHLQKTADALGTKLYSGNRQGVTFPMTDALCWLLAARFQILDVLELEAKGPEHLVAAEGLNGLVNFFTDLCAVQAAAAAGEAARICAELVYGYNELPACTDENCTCGKADQSGAAAAVMEPFIYLRMKLDASLSGARLAKDRAAEALAKVMIPEALDYPA
jgi:hypothetical protein